MNDRDVWIATHLDHDNKIVQVLQEFGIDIIDINLYSWCWLHSVLV